MKVIVPAKAQSSRVKDKNWRPFHEGRCLVDIKIEQLLRAFEPQDIFVSCDDESKRPIVERHGVHFLLRDPVFADDVTPWSDVVTHLVDTVPADPDEAVAWVEVVAPLFDAFQAVRDCWNTIEHEHDSLVTVSPVRQFLLDERGQGVNFNFGPWHPWSQDLPPLYSFESMAIMRKRDILKYNYVIGRKPFLFPIRGISIDIDEPFQFMLAQKIYAEMNS
ncbi:acylneuraminate cytidylyltransferase family protein [Oligoflexus tunisiensis]|uniref:acylneuraminate cytidylyltransferase family protein n=1 Tax=Oligoflexus tunisiensis TaxID=708132 RepID=UPI00114CC516|nr:CMP-N-acetylneuraminic acid synthetase [Oligoflexus tunisiensis]